MRILYLEDEPRDAELVQASLEADDIVCDLIRADNQQDFVEALKEGGFDLILADYTLPLFDGVSALKLAKEIAPQVPFIFVSGTLGDERGVEALKLGATDYVFKSRLTKIAPSVRRALREAEERSQRKRAEVDLQRSEAYLAEAQKLSHTGSFGWEIVTGKIYWSDETYRIFGYEPGSQPTLERIVERTHPEDRPPVQQFINSVVQERKEFDFEHRLLMPDGSVKHLRVVGRPSFSTEDGRMEFVGAVTDVTERKRAEEELRQLVDFVPQVVWVLDPQGNLIHVNRFAREYTGLTLDEYRSLEKLARVHPDDLEKVKTVRDRGLSTNGPFEVDARLLGKDDVYRWFLFRYSPLLKDGALIRWYGTATEIESRKQEEERVRKENVRLEERTRIAQELHDTLLQTFISATMQMSMALETPGINGPLKPRLDRVLQIMNQGITEGRNTIQNLRSADSRSLDLVMSLSSIQEELSVQSGVDFRITVAGRQQPLKTPIRQEIYRIGREALLNAFRHSRARKVELELVYSDRVLHMRVRDDGCGIDPQVLESGRNRHWGLSAMRMRAEKIGAKLRILSRTGGGTEVELRIPRDIAFESHPSSRTSKWLSILHPQHKGVETSAKR